MFKSYDELKAEEDRLAEIENNMWKNVEQEPYIRIISGTLPLQEESTGTLELKEEWLEGIDLEDYGFVKLHVLNFNEEFVEGYEKYITETTGWTAYKTESGYTLYNWVITNEHNGNYEINEIYQVKNVLEVIELTTK